MKRNVDLTENRDFGGSGRLVKFNDFHMIDELEDIENKFVLTGNAEERNSKKLTLSFCVPDNHCDCCGSTKAWDFFGDTLCIKCEEYFNHKIVWWRMKEIKGETNSRW